MDDVRNGEKGGECKRELEAPCSTDGVKSGVLQQRLGSVGDRLFCATPQNLLEREGQ